MSPLPPPCRRLEGAREVLRLVHDLAVAELHNAHRVPVAPLVRDCLFRDPELPVTENPLDLETGRPVGMMTPQGLQTASPEDSLARLGIVTNAVVIVNIVLRVSVADCRRLPVRIQGFTYLFLFHGLLQLLFGSHVHLPCAMKPETPIFTASLSLCLGST
jgi:hypothetical protein